MLQSLKAYDLGLKKQLIEVKKVVEVVWFLPSSIIVTICGVIAQLLQVYDSSKPLSNDVSDSFSPVVSSSILDITDAKDVSNEKESNKLLNEQEISKCQEENDVDADNSECDLPQPSAKRRKVEEMLNERKDKKLTKKLSQETHAFHWSREVLQLKKQLLQKFEEAIKDYKKI